MKFGWALALAACVVFGAEPAQAAAALDGRGMSLWWILPFAGLLLCIATGPLFYPHLWEHHYGKFSAFWAALVIVPLYLYFDPAAATKGLAFAMLLEYLPFIILLFALYTVAGGIFVSGNIHGAPATNTAILFIGAVLASFVGTTGASMILIRPIIRANDNRKSNVHVVIFFIFIVSNVGGALTPLGDPPLFVGFLKGVSFFWTTTNLFTETALVLGILLALFYALDSHLYRKEGIVKPDPTPDSRVRVKGLESLVFIAIIIAAILLRAEWKPGVSFKVLGVDLALQDIASNLIMLGAPSARSNSRARNTARRTASTGGRSLRWPSSSPASSSASCRCWPSWAPAALARPRRWSRSSPVRTAARTTSCISG